MNHTTRLVLFSGILLLGVLATSSQASYIDYDGPRPDGTVGRIAIESFENASFPAQPTSDQYTRTATGTGNAAIDVSQEDTGTQSYKIDGSSTSDDLVLTFTTTTPNICLAGGMRFAIRANEDLNAWAVSLKSASKEAEMRVNMGANTFSFSNGATTSTTNSIDLISTASAAWQHLGITCDGATDVTFVNYDTGSSQLLTGIGTFAPTKIIFTSDTSGTGSGPAINIDSVQWGVPSPGAIFCANPTETDYGYNYRRGGDAFDQADGDVPGIGLSTGYVFTGGTSESGWDYTAKQLSTGTDAAHYNVTIEGATDGTGSIFRVNFATLNGANADVTAKGNGLTTGHFADHAEVQFLENGNTWQITAWYVTGGGTRTQIGGAANYGDSNDATPFTVWIDNRATANYVKHIGAHTADNWYIPAGTNPQAGPFIAVTVPETIHDSFGNEYDNQAPLFRNLPAAFTDDDILNFWLVGYGDGSLLNAVTALDNNEETGTGYASTCIFDDVGSAVIVGSAGTTPGNVLPPSGGDDDGEVETAGGVLAPGTPLPEGWTRAAFNGFLGVILMGSIGAGAWAIFSKHWVAFAIGSVMGFLLALFFQLFSLWVLIVVVVIAVAIIFLAIKRGAGASG